jgi:hypothetical protein
MFVAGISQKLVSTTPTVTRDRTDSVVSDRRLSEAGTRGDGKSDVVVGLGISTEPRSAEGTASPTEQPRQASGPTLSESRSPPLPTSPPPGDQPPTQQDQQTVQEDPFTTLESNLRQAFSAFSARPKIWKEGVRLDRPLTGGETSASASAAGSRRGSREDREREEKGRLFRILVVDKVRLSRFPS